MKEAQIVEAILFASDAPLRAEEIARADEALDEDTVEGAVRDLQTLYDESERAFQIMELAGGYQILTRPEFAPYLERFDTVPRPSRLSRPAFETLAIIAYRQPIGRIEVEYIRGVGSSGVIRTLQDRGLIDVVGRDESMGRPLLYGTTTRFLEHFGFPSLEALPRPEELPVILRERVSLDPDGEAPADDLAEAETAESEQVEADFAVTDSTDEAMGTVESDEAEELGKGSGQSVDAEVEMISVGQAEVVESEMESGMADVPSSTDWKSADLESDESERPETH